MAETFDPTKTAESIAALARSRGIGADMFAGANDALTLIATLARRPLIKAVLADLPSVATKSVSEEEAAKAEPEQSGVEKLQGTEAYKADEPQEMNKADDKTDEVEQHDETDPGQPEKTDPGHIEASKAVEQVEVEVTFDATALVQSFPDRFSAIEATLVDVKAQLAKSAEREEGLRAELAKSHQDRATLAQLVEQANANARAFEAVGQLLQEMFPIHAAVLEVATKAHVETASLRRQLEDLPGRDRQPQALTVNREAVKLLTSGGEEITRTQLAKALTNRVITNAQWRDWCQTGRFSEIDTAHDAALRAVQKFLSTHPAA